MTPFRIQKLGHDGKLKYAYDGELVERGATWVCVRAPFEGVDEKDLGVVTFLRGDIFIEWHYSDRWYNIFEVNSVGGTLKGWYCNITRPATITDKSASADDLELDMFVTPGGEIHMLDEEDFEALELSADERAASLDALEALKRAVQQREMPFDKQG